MTSAPAILPSLSAAAAQVAVAALALAGLAFAPPASGKMILVPLGAPAGTPLLAIATRHGARLVGHGPFSSYVIDGERDRLIGPLARAGVLLLAAPAAGCRPEPR